MRKWNDFFVIFFFSFGEDGFPKCFSHENEKNIIGAMTAQIAGGPLRQQSYTTNSFANFPTIPQDKKPFVLVIDNSGRDNFTGWVGKMQLASPQAIIIPIVLDRFAEPVEPKQVPQNVVGLHFGWAHQSALITAPTPAARRLIAFTLEILGYKRKDKEFQDYSLAQMRAIANYMNRMNFNEKAPREDALPPYHRSFDDDPIIPKEFWR